jgi:hypothetical protein
MRYDDFSYGGDMYGGDTYSDVGQSPFAVAPTAPAPSLAVDPYAAPPAYSQEEIQRAAQAYVEQQQKANALSTQNTDALNSYIAQQAAKGIEVASTNATGGGPMGTSGVFGLPDFGPRFDPANPTASTGQVFRFDTGSQVGVPGASGEMEYRNAAPVVFQPGEKYILTDPASKKVLGTATTPEEMASLVDMSGKLPYGFQLFQANEQGGFTPGQELFGKDDPRATGVMGAIANYGIPLGMSLLAGPLGPLAAAAAAAGTTGVTKLTSGYTPKDALIAAAISGATAGALKGFTGPTNPLGLEPFGTAAKNAAAEAAAQGAGGALAQGAGGALSQAIPGEILVSALKNAAPSLVSQVAPSLVQAGVSGLSNALLPSQPATVPRTEALDPDLITVTGVRPDNILTNVGSVLPAASSLAVQPAAASLAVQPPTTTAETAPAEDEIVVTKDKYVPSGVASNILTGVGSVLAPAAASLAVQPPTTTAETAPAEDEIVVTKDKYVPSGVASNILTGVGSVLPGVAGQALGGADTTAPPKDKKLGVSDYLQLAGLAATALGALGGGDKGTAAGNVPGGLGALNPIFSAKLPTANIPGGVGTAANFAPRAMGDEDWLTYGQRPEKSFFNYVPQPPTGMAHGGSLEAKRGGRPSRSSFAVNGPGTGRSDDIPAVLSDGEYVIDAETVALLGDGSSKAGAQKLDDLRVKIRKHKGQKLSQGRFSADAKKPEAYLTGGRI